MDRTVQPSPEQASPIPTQQGEIEGGMRTGQGADDEPEMTIGDKYAGEIAPDMDGDGTLTVEEADALLGGDAAAVDRNTPVLGTSPTSD